MKPKAIYLPGLNGLRAIAAIAVVLSHITLALEGVGLHGKIFGTDSMGKARGLDLAGHGVNIFFTLSGFLITYLILKEKEAGKLQIKQFYMRRLLRIWPLYYLCMGLAVLILLYFKLPVQRTALPFYVFFAANIPFITGHAIPLLAPFWSVGVEEQFYLFFPQIAKYSNRTFLKAVLLIIAGMLALKAACWYLAMHYGITLPFDAMTVTRFQIMLIGALGGILFYYNNTAFIKIMTHKATQIIAWGCLLLILLNRFHVASVIDAELVGLMSLCLIVGQVTKKNRIVNLENRFCDFLGKISYSVYIIHSILIFAFTRLVGHFHVDAWPAYVVMYASILTATILVSHLSYEYFEKYFLKMKGRFTVVHSSNTGYAAEAGVAVSIPQLYKSPTERPDATPEVAVIPAPALRLPAGGYAMALASDEVRADDFGPVHAPSENAAVR